MKAISNQQSAISNRQSEIGNQQPGNHDQLLILIADC